VTVVGDPAGAAVGGSAGNSCQGSAGKLAQGTSDARLVRVLEVPGALTAQRELILESLQPAVRIARVEGSTAIRAAHGNAEYGRCPMAQGGVRDRLEWIDHGAAPRCQVPGGPVARAPGGFVASPISAEIACGVKTLPGGWGMPQSVDSPWTRRGPRGGAAPRAPQTKISTRFSSRSSAALNARFEMSMAPGR
jgi:hypothetical protein